jgi:hypothetical protein
MKKMLAFLCITSSMFAMELDVAKSHRVQEIFVPERLGSLELYHNDKGFSIYHDNNKHDVKKYHVDPMLRNINKKQLKGFLKNGYLSVNQMDDGEYSLKAKGRINGGGPIFGAFMYSVTKTICYSAALATTGTLVVTTAGPVTLALTTGAATGVGAAISGAATATTIGATIGTTAGLVTAGATTGAVVGTATGVVGAMGAAVLAPEAAMVTAGVVTSLNTLSGVSICMGAMAGIEALAITVGTFCGMAPTI